MRRNEKAAAIIVSILILSGLGIYVAGKFGGPGAPSTHVVAVDRVAVDRADAPKGSAIYVLLTNESNSGKDTWDVNSTSFQVVSNRSSSYHDVWSSFPGPGTTTAIPVKAGQFRAVELTFRLPADERPERLVYDDRAVGAKTTVAVPPTLSGVSMFNDVSYVKTGGQGDFEVGIIANALVLNTTYPNFPGNDRVFYTFFSGDRVSVAIVLQYYKQPTDPATIRISSVTNTDGFTIVSVRPALPVSMTGWGSRAEVQVTLLAPEKSYSGELHFVVGFTS